MHVKNGKKMHVCGSYIKNHDTCEIEYTNMVYAVFISLIVLNALLITHKNIMD